MARIIKKLSTECKDCGVVFDENNPKQPLRALCVPCYLKDATAFRAKVAAIKKENQIVPNRSELYYNYREDNRAAFWKEINKQIRPLKKREDILAFISKQMDRIMGDKTLMDYINHTAIVENEKQKQKHDKD